MSLLDPKNIITLHEANVRDITFQLRRVGRREPFDVTGQLIRLTSQKVETQTNDPIQPIDADALHVDADFATGKVIITVDGRITDVVGSYDYALTLKTATEEITLQAGRIEVKERAGFPYVFKIDGVIEVPVVLDGTFTVV